MRKIIGLDGLPIYLGRPANANADMMGIKAARRAKFRYHNAAAQRELNRLRRLGDKLRRRKDIMKYVFGMEE